MICRYGYFYFFFAGEYDAAIAALAFVGADAFVNVAKNDGNLPTPAALRQAPYSLFGATATPVAKNFFACFVSSATFFGGACRASGRYAAFLSRYTTICSTTNGYTNLSLSEKGIGSTMRASYFLTNLRWGYTSPFAGRRGYGRYVFLANAAFFTNGSPCDSSYGIFRPARGGAT